MTDPVIYIAVRRDLPEEVQGVEACRAAMAVGSYYGQSIAGISIVVVRTKDREALDRMCLKGAELGAEVFTMTSESVDAAWIGATTCAAIVPVDKSKVPLLVNAELF